MVRDSGRAASSFAVTGCVGERAYTAQISSQLTRNDYWASRPLAWRPSRTRRFRSAVNVSAITVDRPATRESSGMAATIWSRWVWPILSGKTRRVALPIALVVGTILLVVNQGADLLTGEVDAATLLRVVGNYAIPYVVSSVGYLNALTGQGHGSGRDASRS